MAAAAAEDRTETNESGERFMEGEVSVFLREGDRVFHTYSSYGDQVDLLHNTFNYLDLTPLGRQDDAPGRPWLRHHDKYAV